MQLTLIRKLASLAVIVGAVSVSAGTIVSVVESGGDTDRPSAKFTGQTFDISNPNGTVLVAGYTVPTFDAGAKSMTDRTHAYAPYATTSTLPAYLVGNEYIMIANNDRDNASYTLAITLNQPANLYLLIDNRLGDADAATPPSIGPTGAKMTWVDPAAGWTPVTTGSNRALSTARPDEIGIDESADGSINNWSSVYTKTFDAGTLQLKEFNEGSRNMYGVVVGPAIPEPSTLALSSLGLAFLGYLGWRRNRR